MREKVWSTLHTRPLIVSSFLRVSVKLHIYKNVSSINHREMNRDDSLSGSQEEKHGRQHYQQTASCFQLAGIRSCRICETQKKKAKRKKRQTDGRMDG